MSFNKTVNGVTFTSDNFTNIDVHFDKQDLYTHIYISTTDNQAFSSGVISDYHLVHDDNSHDDNSLRIILAMLENDNKTAKLYVHTSDFNEHNSYNIQQLPLKKTGSTQKTDSTQKTGSTQKLENYSENGYKVYIPNDCTSINGMKSISSYYGYEIVPPTGVTLNNDIVKTIYADVNGDNSIRVHGTLDGNNVKFIFGVYEWSSLNYSHVRDTNGNLIYNLQDYVKQLTPKFTGTITNHIDNTSYTHDAKTITLTANDGYKITSASINFQPYIGASYSNIANFTIKVDGKTATATIPSDYLNNSSTKLELNGKTENTKPYTLADVGLKCNDENVTLSVTDNTATLTAASGYKITSAKITSTKHHIFQKKYDFTISKDGSSATITLTPSNYLDYDLKVTIEEKPSEPQPQPSQPDKPQPSQPETKKFNGILIFKDDVKDKIKFEFDNQKTVKISVIDNKYNINSLYYLYQLHPGSKVENSSNGFTINTDKKTATLVIPDDILNVYNLKIGGDIADTTPLEPQTTTAKTQWVYMVDDKGLTELTKQAENNPKVGANPNYDFTEFINQLYYLPFTVDDNLSTPTNKIYTGLRSLNIPAREMKDNVLNIDLGTINVNPENNNGFDYDIESIKLYLPLVLPIKIDFQDCYKKQISINYQINLLTGNATINVLSNDKLISTFNQNVQTNLQMFNIYNNKDFGSLNNSINNGLLTPYIKVNYYKPVENLVSYETLEHNNLSSYTNFVKTRNASVSCGTQEEQQEIESLLNGGIYIK